MKFVGLQIDMSKLFIRDLTPNGVLAVIQAASALSLLAALVRTVLGAIPNEPLAGHLWVVEPGRIRVYRPPESPA